MRTSRWAAALAVATALTAAVAQETKKLTYPDTKKGDVADDYHGTRVADPYRWLEDDVRKSKDVAAWVEAENKVTAAFLESIPQRAAIRKRVTELWDYEKFSAPFKVGGRYFFFKNDGLQNQNVLYVMDSPASEPARLLDPHTWSKHETEAAGPPAVRGH